ncbi:MAG: hypothetical protein RI988_301 [Pseudomonadota bacterium]|jgi:hypothetical protein
MPTPPPPPAQLRNPLHGKTSWAREKVESLDLFMLRDLKRGGLPRTTG